MKRIGIISDTHGYWDERFAEHFSLCDEIWHVGDIGSMEVAERLSELVPIFRAVHGNIDGGDIRRMFPEVLRFRCEEADILLKHIGGYPGHYDRSVFLSLRLRPPHLFVCGHSHILRVMYDKSYQFLHINPGAAGLYGCQRVRTLVLLTVDGHEFKDCQVVELGNMPHF
ncbi:MAG: metallophosphoesterase family protein [Bacteroidaceae bacterium]|nr:metallophosphoesterase family protein [Bacteroidaceae bacterium]